MTVKEYLAGLAKKAGIADDNEDLQVLTAASALNEIEIPESLSGAISKGFYTKEAAKNDKEIQDFYYEKISKGIYSNFDEVIEQGLESLPLSDEQKELIRGKETSTQKQRELLKAVANLKKGKSDVDVEKFNTQIQELNEQLKKAKETHNQELENIKKQSYDNETNFLIKNKILSAPLIDKIPGGKDFLAEATINKVRSTYHIERDDKNNILIKDKDDPTREVYVDNEKVDFDKLLSNELHDFIKRSEEPKPGPTKPHKSEAKEVSQMTVQERIRLGVA